MIVTHNTIHVVRCCHGQMSLIAVSYPIIFIHVLAFNVQRHNLRYMSSGFQTTGNNTLLAVSPADIITQLIIRFVTQIVCLFLMCTTLSPCHYDLTPNMNQRNHFVAFDSEVFQKFCGQ